MTEEEIYNGTVNDFIALTFKGLSYESVIRFVEKMLLKLKEDAKTSTVIKDILGR